MWRKDPDGWKIELYYLGATDVPYGCWWKARWTMPNCKEFIVLD